jgi:hypothetical protein
MQILLTMVLVLPTTNFSAEAQLQPSARGAHSIEQGPNRAASLALHGHDADLPGQDRGEIKAES